ncbi:MAG: MBL fold metallo-hydrolase [Nitrososphaerales archaeon]|nr:MBL fold metallo-hydrolase [Nitrososphaerales archaeon]
MSVVEVAGGIYARVAKGDEIYDGWGANQGFIVAEKGVVVIDSGFTRGAALSLLREIRKRTRLPVRVVINTHDHSDHVFGNSVFESSGALILGHSVCWSRMEELGETRMRGYRSYDARLRKGMNGLRVTPPSVSYSESARLNILGREVELIHPPAAHTRGDTMILLPKEKVLFAGDVVWEAYHPNLEDGDVHGWIDALRTVERMEVADVVPGHGRPTDRSSATRLSDYIAWFDAKMKDLAARKATSEEAAEELRVPGSERWGLKMIIKRNVDMLFPGYKQKFGARSWTGRTRVISRT